MKFSILAAFAAASALAPLAGAFPTWPGYGKPQPQPRSGTDLSRLAQHVPQSTLPAPPAGYVLKFVGLGIGTQNYTCLTNNETAAPGTTGALADLYNIGTVLNARPQDVWKLTTLSGLALSMKSAPQMLDAWLRMQGFEKVLGHHFFTQLTPTFSLDHIRPMPYPQAFVTKDVAIDAPKSACPGTMGEGAVQWLKLSDKTGASIGGVNTVYRLETAGGKSPATCKGMKQTFERPYAAQYYVWGPSS